MLFISFSIRRNRVFVAFVSLLLIVCATSIDREEYSDLAPKDWDELDRIMDSWVGDEGESKMARKRIEDRRRNIKSLLLRSERARIADVNETVELRPAHERGVHSTVGIMLYAEGRTGTSSLADSLRSTAHLHFCFGYKEGFDVHNITEEAFQRCNRVAKRTTSYSGFITHIKPMHHLRNYLWYILPRPVVYMSAANVFEIARGNGVDMVITAFRDNQLERLISSFELKLSHYPELQRTAKKRKPGTIPVVETKEWKDLVRSRFLERDVIQDFEFEARTFLNGTKEALAHGMTVIELSFDQYIGPNLCLSVKELIEEIRKILIQKSKRDGTLLPNMFNLPMHCKKVIAQTSSSHHHWSMDARIGKDSANAIRNQLRGTPYEWMLDLKKIRWPKDVPRPIPIRNVIPGVHSLPIRGLGE
jgi:hypothetical protein